MQYNLTYSIGQLNRTALYIWENNPSVKNWDNCEIQSINALVRYIRDFLVRKATENARILRYNREPIIREKHDWITYAGTGGFFILFSDLSIESTPGHQDEDITIFAEIFVDPAVGDEDKGYVSTLVEPDLF